MLLFRTVAYPLHDRLLPTGHRRPYGLRFHFKMKNNIQTLFPQQFAESAQARSPAQARGNHIDTEAAVDPRQSRRQAVLRTT